MNSLTETELRILPGSTLFVNIQGSATRFSENYLLLITRTYLYNNFYEDYLRKTTHFKLFLGLSAKPTHDNAKLLQNSFFWEFCSSILLDEALSWPWVNTTPASCKRGHRKRLPLKILKNFNGHFRTLCRSMKLRSNYKVNKRGANLPVSMNSLLALCAVKTVSKFFG